MSFVFKFLVNILIGYAAHQTSYLFDRWEANGAGAWSRLGRYSVGTVALALGFAVVSDAEMSRAGAFEKLLTAAVGVGSGVAGGYVVDNLEAYDEHFKFNFSGRAD